MWDISIWGIIAQIINFGILFFLFSKFLTKPITNMVEKRRELIKKLEQAELSYSEKINEAEEEKKTIINDAMIEKEKIIMEAWMLASKRKEEILDEAKNKANLLIEDAEVKSKHLWDELEKNFISSVKKTSKMVVNKLFNKDIELKEKYLDEILAWIKK